MACGDIVHRIHIPGVPMCSARTPVPASRPVAWPDERAVAVVGAYGHTGRFVVAELLRRGATPVLIGRDRAKLDGLRDLAPDARVCVASIEDPDSLDRAFHGAAAVVNCAGPFGATARPVADAGPARGPPVPGRRRRTGRQRRPVRHVRRPGAQRGRRHRSVSGLLRSPRRPAGHGRPRRLDGRGRDHARLRTRQLAAHPRIPAHRQEQRWSAPHLYGKRVAPLRLLALRLPLGLPGAVRQTGRLPVRYRRPGQPVAPRAHSRGAGRDEPGAAEGRARPRHPGARPCRREGPFRPDLPRRGDRAPRPGGAPRGRGRPGHLRGDGTARRGSPRAHPRWTLHGDGRGRGGRGVRRRGLPAGTHARPPRPTRSADRGGRRVDGLNRRGMVRPGYELPDRTSELGSHVAGRHRRQAGWGHMWPGGVTGAVRTPCAVTRRRP
ncbi:NAD(P)H-binding protein [Streptomyces sp. NPDC052000]|uniref:NAD(P)H-binding protein n=1 Tax=Streptomyces sp. NPDC052000 TaxID=3155676 RepID=UPI00344C14A4